jgi:hypothetical protein
LVIEIAQIEEKSAIILKKYKLDRFAGKGRRGDYRQTHSSVLARERTYPAIVPRSAARVSVLKLVVIARITKHGTKRTKPMAFSELGPNP